MNILITLIYFLAPILIILMFIKYKWVKKVGTVILAYAVGIILALFGLTAGNSEIALSMNKIQTMLMNITVPLAIPLMLFSSDFKLWTRSLPKMMMVLLGGIVSVIVAVVAGFFVFRNTGIDDLPNVAAMMTSIYTGGTMNFYALGASLNVDPNTIVIAYTCEMLVTFPFVLFLVGGGYKVFRRLLPFQDETLEPNEDLMKKSIDSSFEDYQGIFNKKTFPKTMLALLLSLGILAVGAGLSFLLTGKLNEMIIILTITTISIAFSFVKKIRELPKTFELGMFFILIFSVVVASEFDIFNMGSTLHHMLLFVLFVMIVSIVLHLIISRISKVNGDLFAVGHVAMLCSPPFIPPLVSAMGNRKVLISGIVIGLVGYAVGTYLGIALSYLLKLF